VRGELILDDTYFDGERWLAEWGGVSARAFHAPVGALAANDSSFAVEVRPPGSGGAANVSIDPPTAFFELVDRTKAGGGALAVERQSAGQRDRVVVSGSPPAGGDGVVIFRSVSDPALYAAAVFRMQLAAHGIAVDGADRVGPVPPGFRELLAFKGKPLADIVRLCMKFSNNNIAEMLVKDLGAAQSGPPGTWANGVAAARQQLVALGLSASGFQTVDGSGLAARNRVSPRALVDALRIARASFAFGPELESALPIAGRDGTLTRRANGAANAVRAKTGLLAGAASLSGYARTRDGPTSSSRCWSTTTSAATPTRWRASTGSPPRWCSETEAAPAAPARRSAFRVERSAFPAPPLECGGWPPLWGGRGTG
jgi:D-alanyl-D-alanine carboxypeptidase/D-alanyl-D-alanine-endopeptidase (penicillin-binding protein 4)